MTMQFRIDGTQVTWNAHPKLTAWFTTRLGGVSHPPFDSLNLSYGVGDVSSNVTENRRRALAMGGASLGDVVMPHQVHQNHVEWITKSQRGRGAEGQDPIDATDGFLSDSVGVVLGMGFADCVPIFLTDTAARFIGILHAGWRGTVAQIQRLAVEELGRRGIGPQDILVGIGPSIGPCCYEVDQPVVDAVTASVGSTPLRQKDESHWWLNLQYANRILLEAAGVPSDQIVESGLCTGCRRDLFFSYRMQGRRSGRMGGFICLNSH